jgi:hypothetical protein
LLLAIRFTQLTKHSFSMTSFNLKSCTKKKMGQSFVLHKEMKVHISTFALRDIFLLRFALEQLASHLLALPRRIVSQFPNHGFVYNPVSQHEFGID